MTLSFFDETENRELVHRIERDREPEEKRYRAKKAEIYTDFDRRGLRHSTVYTGAWCEEEIHHLRQILGILRNAIFEIVESKNIALSDPHVAEITKLLQQSSGQIANQIEQELADVEDRLGLSGPTSCRHVIQMQIGQAIQRESVTEVSIRAAELRRKQVQRTNRKRSERLEKLAWTFGGMVGGAILGILGTLATQWLTGSPP